jgi:hypothetical protein
MSDGAWAILAIVLAVIVGVVCYQVGGGEAVSRIELNR